MNTDRKSASKWGFGMAPISTRMRTRYDNAIQHLSDIASGSLSLEETLPELLSEAKGMMNRCVREDQWDWFTVFTEFGSPDRRLLRQLVSHIAALRRAAVDEDEVAFADRVQFLNRLNVLQLLYVYQSIHLSQAISPGAGWIYILSNRDNPNILKIGRTERSVIDRVREINSATGVLVPWAARRTYRVRNIIEAEAEIHRHLASHRIRMDREFFEVSIKCAAEVIEEYLAMADQAARWHGKLAWYDRTRGFGFVSCGGHPDVFLHRSQLSTADREVVSGGMNVSFLLGRQPQGPCAIDAKIAAEATILR